MIIILCSWLQEAEAGLRLLFAYVKASLPKEAAVPVRMLCAGSRASAFSAALKPAASACSWGVEVCQQPHPSMWQLSHLAAVGGWVGFSDAQAWALAAEQHLMRESHEQQIEFAMWAAEHQALLDQHAALAQRKQQSIKDRDRHLQQLAQQPPPPPAQEPEAGAGVGQGGASRFACTSLT